MISSSVNHAKHKRMCASKRSGGSRHMPFPFLPVILPSLDLHHTKYPPVGLYGSRPAFVSSDTSKSFFLDRLELTTPMCFFRAPDEMKCASPAELKITGLFPLSMKPIPARGLS